MRELAYSTFTVLHISTSGLLSIFQYDNPSAILLRDGAEVEIPFSSFIVGDKVIESARMQLQKGDVIIAVSDGVENAGVAHGGASYEGRWGRADIAAVSYTHLDVYKRQRLYCRIHPASAGK